MTGFEPGILFVIIGLGLMLAIRTPLDRLHGALLLPMGFMAGVYLVTLAMLIPANLTRTFFMPLFWALALAAAGVMVWRRRELRERLGLMRGGFRKIAMPVKLLIVILAGTSLYNVYLVIAMAYTFPVVGYDAVSNYMLKAALWYDTRELFPEKLMDPEFLMYHRRYPPALSIAEMVWFHVLGGIELIKIKGFFITSWLLVSAVVYALLRRRNGPGLAWVGVAVWLMLPYHLTEYQGGVIDGYPDVPLILGMLCALALVREFGRERALGPAALMAFAVGSCIMIKQEGLIFAGFLILYLLVLRAPLRNVAMIIGFLALNIAIWQVSGRGVPSHLDEKYGSINVSFGEIGERLAIFKDHAAMVCSEKWHWGLVFPLLAVVWGYKLLRVPWKHWVSLELLLGVGLSLTYIVILFNTPLDFNLHLESTVDRLFLHSLPLYIIATFDRLETGRPLSEFFIFRKIMGNQDSSGKAIAHDA